MNKVTDIFGSMVFNETVMKARLPQEVYTQVQRSVKLGERLDDKTADTVAGAMRDWAIEKGVTHFTHWFQPMTGITAEKHDSFIAPAPDGGIIMEFSGKELIQGEPDASSFPNGGLRATFEARGYTAWDPTSYAFIKDGVLCIPTAFCSYGGEALDKKTPLLRSMEALNRQCLRVLRLFGNEDVTAVRTTVGPEQEYFLIDESVYNKRRDLIQTGRTLFGAKPPKSQELGDHYFGAIKPRVVEFMGELDRELWKLGVLAKTEHNEAAPAQHELAPIFSTANISADHNQIAMELMQKTARKHGMVCLLHEKPFEGINGSGKHNNWSLATNTGVNLFEPGETPNENAQFLLMLCAVIQAVDDYQDMLRISVSSAGNDHRLGVAEAPPAIVSVYLGDEIGGILDAIESGVSYGGMEREQIKVGVHVLPKLPKDTTDRNRTSPFAFTGNKFEFRMPGSSSSISGPNVVFNTAVAESLRQYADELEGSKDFENDLHELIRRVIREHKRIIFNGNSYGEEWIKEAKKRGLSNYPATPDCVPHYLDEKNVELFEKHRVYTSVELAARCRMKLDDYCKKLRIEALTMLDMARQDIMPAASEYSMILCGAVSAKKQNGVDASFELKTAERISRLLRETDTAAEALSEAVTAADNEDDEAQRACAYRDTVLGAMDALRSAADSLELITAKKYWPYPSYSDILFSVN